MSKDTDRRLLKRFSRCPKASPEVSLNFTSDALRSKIWCFRKRFNPSHRLRVRLRNNIKILVTVKAVITKLFFSAKKQKYICRRELGQV